MRVRGVYTNTVPVDAYRGAGRPEAAYVIERLVDAAARELDIAPDALRRRNFIKPKAMPYTTATDKIYDTGDFAAHMARAQQLADWDGFKKRASASKKNGMLRGIGMATYIEACGNMGADTATVKLEKDGGVTALIGSQSSGQGHATAYAQIVADHLGLPPERVSYRAGRHRPDRDRHRHRRIELDPVRRCVARRRDARCWRTISSGSPPMRSKPAPAIWRSRTARCVSPAPTVSITFADLAKRPDATPDKLTAADAFDPPQPTYPNGTHIAEVEIDEATGTTRIVNYVVVDDFGVTLNPLLLAGQVHGGAVQGIGQALMEQTVYDQDSGQLVTASLMDYALPRASEMPAFAFETRNVPCKVNPLGVKGAGEAGAIGSCPAVMNAILDALWRAYRIRHLDMPATPERVWAAIEEARQMHRM